MSPKQTSPSWQSLLTEHLYLARYLRRLVIRFDSSRCHGDWTCYEVCPVGCWTPDRTQEVAIFHKPDRCVACGACVLQCPHGAIELTPGTLG